MEGRDCCIKLMCDRATDQEIIPGSGEYLGKMVCRMVLFRNLTESEAEQKFHEINHALGFTVIDEDGCRIVNAKPGQPYVLIG